jgi:hypothetical protein
LKKIHWPPNKKLASNIVKKKSLASKKLASNLVRDKEARKY